jgi:cell division control protein 6
MTKAKVRAIQDDLKKKKSIFSDKRYLESLGFPATILGREEETKQILNFLNSGNYIPPLISIYGRSGTGKSTIMKIISEGLGDGFTSCFVNLRKSTTIFGCTNLILHQLDKPKIKKILKSKKT